MSADRPTFQSESTSGNFGTRLDKAMSEIRELYKQIPYRSSQVDALINLRTLLGLYLQHGPENIATAGMNAIIARRKQDDPKYKDAMDKIDELTNKCLVGITGNDELLAVTNGLNDRLRVLVEKLYPEHTHSSTHTISF